MVSAKGAAMPGKRGKTADRILVAARAIVRASGPDQLTFDAVAAEVGVSKQAVLYCSPTRPA